MDATPATPADREQLKRIIETRMNYLMAVAWQIKGTHLQTEVGVSDLVMETMRTALAKVEKGEVDFTNRSDKEVNGWLVKVLKYTWNDIQKHHKTGKRTPTDLPVRRPLTPSGEAVLKEELERIAEAKAALNPADRQILNLRDEEDLTFDQIGDRLGFSGSYASKRYHAIKETLARTLDGDVPPSD
ncbi:MAG: RNA polymerase sigma factor [Isosphaeraceae bacterium]